MAGKKEREQEAQNILTKIGGSAYAAAEMAAIAQIFHNQQKEKWKDLLQLKYHSIVLIGLIVAVFSQITGINSILYYAPMIFKKMGSGTDTALLQTLCVGFTNFVFTFVAIGLMDKIGRKKSLRWDVTCTLARYRLISERTRKPVHLFVQTWMRLHKPERERETSLKK